MRANHLQPLDGITLAVTLLAGRDRPACRGPRGYAWDMSPLDDQADDLLEGRSLARRAVRASPRHLSRG
jgi:hypothetical protein